MADITITIPNAQLTRIVDGICNAYNYAQAIEGVQNPPTKNQFAKTMIIDFVKQTVRNQEGNIAAQTARTTVDTDINSINIT